MNHFIYRKKRKILLAAISMGVLAASISAFHGPEAVYAYTATAGTINDGPVKVRNAPVTGDKLTLLYPGNAVTVTDETAGSDGYTWYQIQMSDGVTGYIRSDFVTLQGTDSSAGQMNADSSAGGTNGVVQNTEKGVYVRSGAGTSYSVVTKVYKGQAVNVGELVSAGGMNWYSVTLVVGGASYSGWICADYVAVNGQTSDDQSQGETTGVTDSEYEAALAAARLGFETIMFTVSVDSIALMPCNPNVGGSSKGHLVRELDALGGEMGKNIDATFIQSKMLNKSKGPAVHSLRAQADKQEYSKRMRNVLENTDHLTIRQAEVSELIAEDGVIKGLKTFSGAVYNTKAVVLCTGTYLKARCIFGDISYYTGPNGLLAANYLSDSMRKLGIEIVRFKTGTPARVDGRTIDFDKMEEQRGDTPIVPFSFATDPDDIQKEQVSCWLTYTNEQTHDIIRKNIDRSPLYSGVIHGTGQRYCNEICGQRQTPGVH